MKTLVIRITLVAITTLSFLSLATNLKAQCPYGWDYGIRGLVINNCLYTVTICYTCSPYGASPATVKVLKVENNGCPELTDAELIDALIGDYKNICTAPACTQDCLNLFIMLPRCTQIFYNMNFINGQWRFYAWKEWCSESWCGVLNKVCYNQNGQLVRCPGTVEMYSSYGSECPNTVKLSIPTEFDPLTMQYSVNAQPWGACSKERDCR